MTSSTFRLVLDDAMVDRLVEATSHADSFRLLSLYQRCRRRIIFRPRDLEGAERDIAQIEEIGGVGHRTFHMRSRLARARGQWNDARVCATRAHDMAVHDDLERQFHSLFWLYDLVSRVGPADAERAYAEELLRKSAMLPYMRPQALLALARSMNPRPGDGGPLETSEHRQEAIRVYTEAIQCAHEYGLRALEDQLVGELGSAMMYAARWDEAAAQFEAAMSRAEERGDRLEFARGLIGLGRLEYMRHRDREARSLFGRAAAMVNSAPDLAYTVEAMLVLVDLANGVQIGDRLKTLVENAHKATGPGDAPRLREARLFLAASAGDPDAAEVALAEGDQSTAMAIDLELATALIDIARARRSLARGESSATEAALNSARVRLEAAYPNDDLSRLVERAIADLEHEMSSKS